MTTTTAATWLWPSALLMGLAGGPHCLAMCGAACAAITGRCGGARPQRAMLAWQLGRAVGYTAAGAVVASSAVLLGQWGREVAFLKPFWAMLHLAALVLGLWLVWRARPPRWMGAWLDPSAWLKSPSPRAPAGSAGAPGKVLWLQASAAGAAWVALPCGLLQSALVVAALGSTAVDGALVMAAFALGSGLSLWVGPRLWAALAGAGGAAGPAAWRPAWANAALSLRLAGLLLALGSGWALLHAAVPGTPAPFCL